MVVELDGDLNVREKTTVVQGQGLRGIGYFRSGGKRLVIGSQHPFLNAGYQHAFYMVLE